MPQALVRLLYNYPIVLHALYSVENSHLLSPGELAVLFVFVLVVGIFQLTVSVSNIVYSLPSAASTQPVICNLTMSLLVS